MAIPTPISYYKLDGNGTDSLGTYNLTRTSITDVTGKIGQGASHSTGSGLSQTTAYGWTATGNMTVAGWYYFNNLPGSGQYFYILQLAEDANDTQIEIVFDYAAGVRMYAGKGRINVNNAPSTLSHGITTGAWFHIAVTVSNSVCNTYINGVSKITGTNSGNGISYSGGNKFNTGGPNNLVPSFIVDELGIWSTALSSTEVGELYNGGAGISYPFVSSTTNSGFFMFF